MAIHVIEWLADKYEIPAKEIYKAIRAGELKPYPNDWGNDPIHAVDEWELCRWLRKGNDDEW